MLLVPALAFLVSCNGNRTQQDRSTTTAAAHQDVALGDDSITYQTENLIVRRLSEHVYEHTSYLETEDFGKVPCNGMIVTSQKEAVVFDTPANVGSTKELMTYISEELSSKINAVVATHFHADCVAGLDEFHAGEVPSYAHQETARLLKSKGAELPQPQHVFGDVLTLSVGDKKVYAEHFGEGHTKDNIIAYFPEDKALFGGCLVKEVGAGKGNLEDANVEAWSATVEKIRQKYPDVEIVIPGHGKSGGVALLDYTIGLFE